MSATRIGIAGLGTAGLAFVAPLRKHAGFEWVAAAEPDDAERDRCAREHGVEAYRSLGELLAHPGLDAVYLATPTELHTQQVLEAARAGKHILVEKPVALSMAAGRAMVEAAEAAGVVLVVGHSHSHDLPIRRMRELIDSGELGAVGMANTWCYTDWVQRPRRAAELDPTAGGGVTFRQGAHQFDILRLLCGGMARSIRARSFDWDPQRSTVGAHSAWIDFEGGAAATAIYNGYGGFSSMDLCGDISEWGFHQPPGLRTAHRDDAAAGSESALRQKRDRSRTAIPNEAPHQPFFGLTLVSCERGDLRQTPDGLRIDNRAGSREIALATGRSPRALVLEEFHDAISGRRPALHDGRWGLATLELCVAAQQSSRTGAEVRLSEQVPVPAPGGASGRA